MTAELDRICALLHIDPEQTEDLVYQTLELEGQSMIHVVPGDGSLAYIWLILNETLIPDVMDKLIEFGEEEQASRQLASFKLVLASPETSGIEFTAHKQFREIENKKPTTELILSTLA
jgi:hypothetical protein